MDEDFNSWLHNHLNGYVLSYDKYCALWEMQEDLMNGILKIDDVILRRGGEQQ